MSHFPLKAGDAFNLMSEQTHLEATLQRDIDTIRSKVERMAGLVESALSDSVMCFWSWGASMMTPLQSTINQYSNIITRHLSP